MAKKKKKKVFNSKRTKQGKQSEAAKMLEITKAMVNETVRAMVPIYVWLSIWQMQTEGIDPEPGYYTEITKVSAKLVEKKLTSQIKEGETYIQNEIAGIAAHCFESVIMDVHKTICTKKAERLKKAKDGIA